MLTIEQKELIYANVDAEYFDVERLISYLESHDVINAEVFAMVERIQELNLRKHFDHIFLSGYIAVDKKDFIRRVPFFFYRPADSEEYDCSLKDLIIGLNSYDINCGVSRSRKDFDERLKLLYSNLEYLYYDIGLPISDIFNYYIEQSCVKAAADTYELFLHWIEYIKICVRFGWNNMLPANFITAYNEALEYAGYAPIIYDIYVDGYSENLYEKNGKLICFKGIFPVDKKNRPIMKWIGLKISNCENIYVEKLDALMTNKLYVEVEPNTIINARFLSEEGYYWERVYTGPLEMDFNHRILSERRNELGYTQQELASAIDVSVRTYQKWENGITQPDGKYLIRLINWLDIKDIEILGREK